MMKHERKRRCGAKAKSTGQPCRRFAMPNGRCRLHGGVVKLWKNRNQFVKGNTASLTHGIYSERLFDHEKKIWENIPLGNINSEIKMLKIILRRRYQDLKILEEVKMGKDFSEEIQQIKAKLKELELKRARLIENH